MSKRFQSHFNRISGFIERPWYLPLLAAFAAVDIFVIFIPLDALLISSSVVRPRQWIRNFIWLTTGSALGAISAAWAIRYFGDEILHRWFKTVFESAAWGRTEVFIGRHGLWALFLVAAGPFPLQPGALIAGLARMSYVEIFVSVWIGRSLKWGAFSWAASHAPKLLSRLRFLR